MARYENAEQAGREIDAAVETTGHLPGHFDNDAEQAWLIDQFDAAMAAGKAMDEAEAEEARDAASRFTAEQLNGNACTVCSGTFSAGEPSQPSGYVIDHGQLFAHTACLDESEA